MYQVVQARTHYTPVPRSLPESITVGSSISRFTYDTLGRVLTAIDGGNHQTSFTYQPGGLQNLASVTKDGKTTQFGYDAYGRPDSVTNALGQLSTTSYDLLNRPVSASAPGRGNSSWNYNDPGRVYTFIDGTQQRYTTVLNALGAPVADSSPSSITLSDRYTYDNDGNLTATITRAGRNRRIERDVLGRPTFITVDGAIVATFAYDTARKWTAYSNAESSDTVYVDGDGRVTRQATLRGSQRYAVVTTYGVRGQKRSITLSSPSWSSASTSEVDVDSLLRPDYVGTFAGSWTSIVYNQDQQPQRIGFPPVGTAPRRRQMLGYTTGDQLASSLSNVAPDALSWSYGYDALGRLDQLTQGEGIYAAVRSAAYDSAGRLAHWTDHRTVDLPPQWVCDIPNDESSCHNYYGTESQVVRDSTYTYDAVGNRTDLGAVVQAGNRLTSYNGYTMTYDDDGNLLTKSGHGVSQSPPCPMTGSDGVCGSRRRAMTWKPTMTGSPAGTPLPGVAAGPRVSPSQACTACRAPSDRPASARSSSRANERRARRLPDVSAA